MLLYCSGIYYLITATKPDTVGLGLTTSPLGLASYILEKFSTWTHKDGIADPRGSLTKKFSMDDLLTNLMVYWINGNIIPSQRYYKENLASDLMGTLDQIPIEDVPVGLAAFSQEIFVQPKSFVTPKFRKLLTFSDLDGGHFAAFEEPKQLFDDIVNFVGKTFDTKGSKSEL